MQERNATCGSLYLHLYADGECFIHRSDMPCGMIADISSVRGELYALKDADGLLLYSVDQDEHETDIMLATISEMILHFDLDVEFIDPQPEVYGFRESYVPHLNEAFRLALEDVEGLQSYLDQAKRALALSKKGSRLFAEREALVHELQKRLLRARTALKKISELQIDLCVEPEGLRKH